MIRGRTNIHLVFDRRSDAEAVIAAIDANMGLPKPDVRRQRRTRIRMREDNVKTSKIWAKIRQRNTDGKYYFRKASIKAMEGITPREYNYTEEEFDNLWTFIPEEQ